MVSRRGMGTGSIWFTAPHWIASVRVAGKSVRRKRRSREDAEQALEELFETFGQELGYHYHQPRPYRWEDRPIIEAPARVGLSPRLRFAILRRDGFRCRYCGATAQEQALAVDHVQAVADGGTNDPGNLVTACQPCNAGKADQSLGDAERQAIGVNL